MPGEHEPRNRHATPPRWPYEADTLHYWLAVQDATSFQTSDSWPSNLKWRLKSFATLIEVKSGLQSDRVPSTVSVMSKVVESRACTYLSKR